MRTTIFLALALLSGLSLAESDSEIRAAEQEHQVRLAEAQARIPELVEKYASTLGCGFNMNNANVVPYTLNGEPVYISVLGLDPGCSGGNAMQRAVVVVVGQSFFAQNYVIAEYSTPTQSSELPPTIDKVSLKDGALWVSGHALQDIDALCCPSKPIAGQLKFEAGKWAIHQ